jgi:peptidoglycan hydrolase-like protein with peptidoglycan-binding domain
MAREGIDYSAHGPTLNTGAMRNAGISFAMRYLSHGDPKDLSLGEAQQLAKAGIDVGVVWETTASRALAGHGAGAADAKDAAAKAKSVGMPNGRPIYFAVDFDAGDAQKPAIGEYFKGVASVIGKQRTGVYGGYWVVKYLFDHGLVDFGWQTLAWSGGNRDKRAQLYQYAINKTAAGLSVDLNRAEASDFGQWKPGGVVPGPQPHAPKFPFPAADYIALPNGDSHAHSGKDPADQQKIKEWEHQMVHRGWHMREDGKFDKNEDALTRKFQREKGLADDGKVGPDTWKAAWTAPVT